MKLKLILLFILSISLFRTIHSQYEFPPEYYPTKAHPRIWLTEERLNTLKAARASNTPEWQHFFNKVQDLMDPAREKALLDNNYFQYAGGIPYTALMYRLTGDTTYAAKAYYFAMKADTLLHSIDAYLTAGTPYLAIGYDWIYDYMSQSQKEAYARRIISFCNNLWHDALWDGSTLTYTCIDTDRNLSGVAQNLMFGSALYGDNNTEAIKLLNRGWWIWQRGTSSDINSAEQTLRPSPARRWILDAVGGIFYTGLGYTIGTDIRSIAQIFSTLRTACNYDISHIDPALAPFWANMIRGVIDQIDPPRKRLLNIGDFQDSPLIDPERFVPWTKRFFTIASFEAERCGNAEWAAIGRGMLKSFKTSSDDPFNEFLFTTPNAPETDPYSANLPLIRVSNGVDYLFFRSNWSTAANYGTFSAQGSEPVDHQSEDTGCFTLFKDDDYLTRSATGYMDVMDIGHLTNSMYISNKRKNGSPRVRSGGESKAFMARHHENQTEDLFSYAMMQGDGQWNLSSGMYPQTGADADSSRPVKTYRRHFFWAGNYVVVFDRLRLKIAVPCKYRLRALTEPTHTANTITQLSPNGHQKLLHRTLEPANCSIQLVDEAQLFSNYVSYQVPLDERKWQHLVTPPLSDSVNMLSLMQMGNSSMTDFDYTEHISDTNNTGVRIGQWTVIFSTKEELRDKVNYTLKNCTSGMHHLVTDITSGNYYVYANDTEIARIEVNDNDNTASFNTNITGDIHIQISNVPMPVELKSFEGQYKDGQVILKWETATENNNHGFEVERSSDGKDFKTIGFIAGHGNSNLPLKYSFTDRNLSSGDLAFYYRLRQIDNDGKAKTCDIIKIDISSIKEYQLMQNSPNPFNPTTAIKFQIPVSSVVSIKIFDQLGREVRTLLNEEKSSGSYVVYWDGKDGSGNIVSSGTYIYMLTSGNFTQVRKMLFMK